MELKSGTDFLLVGVYVTVHLIKLEMQMLIGKFQCMIDVAAGFPE